MQAATADMRLSSSAWSDSPPPPPPQTHTPGRRGADRRPPQETPPPPTPTVALGKAAHCWSSCHHIHAQLCARCEDTASGSQVRRFSLSFPPVLLLAWVPCCSQPWFPAYSSQLSFSLSVVSHMEEKVDKILKKRGAGTTCGYLRHRILVSNRAYLPLSYVSGCRPRVTGLRVACYYYRPLPLAPSGARLW